MTTTLMETEMESVTTARVQETVTSILTDFRMVHVILTVTATDQTESRKKMVHARHNPVN
ncbi:MAG: hypothetical protein R2741_07485 [Methanolobus sp.]